MGHAIPWRCEQLVTVTRQDGEDDERDRHCVLGVRAYSLGETICLQTNYVGYMLVTVTAASQVYKQTNEHVSSGGAIFYNLASR